MPPERGHQSCSYVTRARATRVLAAAARVACCAIAAWLALALIVLIL
jgi:hypothetical protein